MVKLLFFLCLILLGSLLTLSVAGLHRSAEKRVSLHLSLLPFSASAAEEKDKASKLKPAIPPKQMGFFFQLKCRMNGAFQRASNCFFADLAGTPPCIKTSYRSLRTPHYRLHRTAISAAR